MKTLKFIFSLITALVITSCSTNEDEFANKTNITLNFTHNWNGQSITDALVPETTLVTANGDRLSIERLRYLVSNIHLENGSGITTTLEDHLLIDVAEGKNISVTIENLLLNDTYNAFFTFGFSDADNAETYADLDEANFNVPDSLGGGYHYMQLDGQFDSLNIKKKYNYHTIRAIDSIDTRVTPFFTDTSFLVDLGEITINNNTATIDIEMDVSEWFETPNNWDLNVYYKNLTSNYAAQIKMSANGATVFSLKEEEEL